jgi:hypothetical protein
VTIPARPATARSERDGRRARQIGPIGTVSRAVGGRIAIAVPIALSGIAWIGCVLYTPIDVAEARRGRSRALSAP